MKSTDFIADYESNCFVSVSTISYSSFKIENGNKTTFPPT